MSFDPTLAFDPTLFNNVTGVSEEKFLETRYPKSQNSQFEKETQSVVEFLYQNPLEDTFFIAELEKTKKKFGLSVEARYEFCLKNSKSTRGVLNSRIINLLYAETLFIEQFNQFAIRRLEQYSVKKRSLGPDLAEKGALDIEAKKIEKDEELFSIFRTFFTLIECESGLKYIAVKTINEKLIQKLDDLVNHPSKDVQEILKTVRETKIRRDKEDEAFIEENKTVQMIRLLMADISINKKTVDASTFTFDTKLILTNATPILKYLISNLRYIVVTNRNTTKTDFTKIIDFVELYKSNRTSQLNLYAHVLQDFSQHIPPDTDRKKFLNYRKLEEWINKAFKVNTLPEVKDFFGKEKELNKEIPKELPIFTPKAPKSDGKKTKKSRRRNNKRANNVEENADLSLKMAPAPKKVAERTMTIYIDQTSWLRTRLNIKLDFRVQRWQKIRPLPDIPQSPEFVDYSTSDPYRRKTQKIRHSLHVKLLQIINLSTHVFRNKNNYFAISQLNYPDKSSELGVLEFGFRTHMDGSKSCHHFYFSQRQVATLLTEDPTTFSHFEEGVSEDTSSDVSQMEILDERETITIFHDTILDTYRFHDKVLDTTVVVFPIAAN